MNKRGVHEQHGILIMLALGLLGIGLLLYSAGIVDLPSLSSGTSGITGFASGELGTQEEPLSAAPANQPPTYTGGALSTPVDTPLVVNLAPLFSDPEGDALTFLATSEDQVAVDVTDSTATFTPAAGFSGERTITVVVSDGTNLVREPVRLTVGDVSATEFAIPAPEEQQTTEEPAQNNTLPPETPPEPPAEPSFSTQDVVTNCEPGPVVMNTSTTLTQNISSNDTCVLINASNVALNCAGFTIAYNVNGSNNEFGIIIMGQRNVTVRDCVIWDVNESGGETGGINMTTVNDSLIVNTTIVLNGSFDNTGIIVRDNASRNRIENNTILMNTSANRNVGIILREAANNHIINNTIMTNGTQDNNGIQGNSRFVNNTIADNHITTSGSGPNNAGITTPTGDSTALPNNTMRHNVIMTFGTTGNAGILIDTGANASNVSNNNITASGTGASNEGIITGAAFVIIADNRITTGGTTTNFGIRISGEALRNTFVRNTLMTNGTASNNGIRLIAGTNHTFDRNNITTNGSTSYAIDIAAGNNSLFNNTVLNNPVQWISATVGAFNNFSNTTFEMPNGSIAIVPRVEINGTQDVNKARLNITSNRAYLNSTNLTFLNTTALITLRGINFTNPTPQFDFEDDGIFTDCTSTADPFCTELSFSGGVFVFNTSHFTTFSSINGIVLSKSDDQDPATISHFLTYRITINNTDGNISNVTLTDTYPNEVIFNLSQPNATPGTNNTFFIGNITGNTSFTVNITVRIRSNVLNGTTLNNTANITWLDLANTSFALNVTETTLAILPVITTCPAQINFSTSFQSDQTFLSNVTCFTITNSENVTLDCNGANITYGIAGGNENMGVNITNSNNTAVRECNIQKTSASGNRTYGIGIGNGINTTLENNIILTNGSQENDGIHTGVAPLIENTFGTVNLVTFTSSINSPFCTNATGLGTCRVCFTTGGVDCASLGQSGCSDGEGYKADTILQFNTTTFAPVGGTIQVIGGEAVLCQLNNIDILSFGTRNNCGAYRTAAIGPTPFVAGENNLTCFVAGGGKDEDNGFKLVGFSYEGVTQTVTISTNSSVANIFNNTITADGGINTRGIFLDAHNSNISFNRIAALGDNESHGIFLQAENTTIGFNNITAAKGSRTRGVQLFAANANVTSNNITVTASGSESHGVLVLGNRANITGNTINTTAGTTSRGIQLAVGNASIGLNTVSTASNLSHGIFLDTGANNNVVSGNIINVIGRASSGITILRSVLNLIRNNTVTNATVAALYVDQALNNLLNDTVLNTVPASLFIADINGTINYTETLAIGNQTNLSREVTFQLNFTRTNTTSGTGQQLNKSAVLQFFNLPADGIIPVFDDADDGTFDVCGGSRCLNTTYNQSTGILQYNVTHFTTYAAQEVSACATIDNVENATTVNVTLTNNVSATIDCFTIVAENVTFTCSGNTILYDSAGIGGDGIIVEHTSNIVIRDCVIRDTSVGGAGGIGINITNSSNIQLINNSIQTNGTNSNHGIFARAFNATTQTNFTFTNNTVRTRGSTNNNTGIHLAGGNITVIVIQNNAITTNGTDSNDGIRLAPLFFGHSSFRDVRVIQNTIVTNGSFRNHGLLSGNYISGSGNVHTLVIANNTIRTFGTSSLNNGLYLAGTATNVSILQNNITTNTTTGGSSNAILMDTFTSASLIENITILNNSLRTLSTGTDGIGIELENFFGPGNIRNFLIALNTIITNGTSGNDGLEISGANAIAIENNTIITSGDSLNNAGIEMSTLYANITISTNLINTTGIGGDYGIAASSGTDPENITVTRNNITTGSHRVGSASSSTGSNRGISFTSITSSLILDNFIYTNGSVNNTGIFVGVSSSFNTVANNTVVTGGNETENAGIGLIQLKDEFGSIASNNVTNNTVNTTGFGRSPSNDVGILLMGLGNSGAVENNIVRINTVHARGNDSDNYGVYLVGIVRYNNITNNQVLTNGTDRNHGVAAFSPSTSFQVSDNIIEWNNITAWGIASTDNYGIFFRNLVVRNNVTDNNATTRGSDRNHGAFLNASSNNNRIERNNFTLQTFGTDNTGIIIQGSSNNTILNNFIQTNISVLDGGVALRSSARSNRVSNNTIRTNGTALTLSLSHTNVIQDQNATTQGAGALVMAGSQRNNFTNVIIASDRAIAAEFLPGAGDGAFFDGFEDGTIPPFTTSGNAPWLINNTNVSSGSFSAQAADINDSQSAVLTLLQAAGAGTVSFARKTDSESGFDFLTFAIDGVTQQQWSGNLQYATFNFSFSSASTFTWTYSKDSSVATGADTAWVDNINISFAGNGSINNTFNRTFFLTNNSWLFMGENNTNNTLENATFTGPNGTINILPIVNITPNSNATLGRLNNTHNLSFLNSTNLPFLNTSAILRFLQILFIDPAPFRDLDDDGTFAYCPPSVCAELSYVTGEFVHNTTGFSFYAVSEGQVNLSINKTDNPDPAPVSSQLNYTIIVNNSGSSTAFNLTLLEVYPPEVIFLTAQPTPSSGNNTFFLGNLTPESQITLNITVFVRNVTNGIVINNTVNATFLNQSNATVRANVTESTTINNPPVLNMSTATIAKTDSPDPANTSGTLTYVINVTSTGPGIARNVTVNDTYPPQVIFISAAPTPVTGTNNTFFLGNITNGTSVLINITVLVQNISNNTVINNSANVTFQNNTNFTFTAVATASTTVINVTTETPPAPAPAAGGGSGGGWTTPTVGGVQLEQPVQAAPGPCIENWACDDWSACSLGRQSRTCYDQNACNTTQYVPVQARTCMDIAPPAPEPEEEPLALPDIKVEQEAPAVETPRWSICAAMPLIIDGALLVLAVLALLYLILTARQRAEKYWRTILDAAAGIILALLIVQYVTCKEFLPLQYGVFILLALFILLMRLADHLKARRFAPYTPPAAMPRAPAPEPEPETEPDLTELPPLRITKPAKVPANLRALTAAVKRNEKTMQDFLKVLKKK